jgi:polar amino acid transport system substrate-binding protein
MFLRSRFRSVVAALLAVSLLAFGSAQLGVAASRQSHPQAGLGLLNSHYLTVGSDTTYPPMESVDPNHPGTYIGADVDLANALAKAMGLKGAIIKNNNFQTIIPALQRKRFDVIMSSLSDTPARAKVISFVDYMLAREGILVKKSSSIHTNGYSGVCGLTVSVQSGTTELDGLNAANKHCSKKISIKQFSADTDAFQAFKSGHADAYTSDLPVVAQYVKTNGGTYRLAGKAFGAGGDYGIGLSKSNKPLKAALSKAVAKIRASGQYTRILNKWGVGGAGF